jgi:hypothetical protein
VRVGATIPAGAQGAGVTAKVGGHRSQRWTKRSALDVVYGPFARAGDWWYAGRDARKRLLDSTTASPVLDSPMSVARALGTQRMRFLDQRGAGRLEREWQFFRADVAEPLAGLREVQSRRAALAAELARAQARFEIRLVLLDADPSRRGVGEADETMRVLAARAELLDAQINRLLATVHNRLKAAQTRVVRIEAHTRRRCVAYLGRLVRKHPDGGRINELLAPYWPELAPRNPR